MDPTPQPSAPGAAGASCTSASRWRRSGCRRCCDPARESTRSSAQTSTARERPRSCSARRCAAASARASAWWGRSGTTSTPANAKARKAFRASPTRDCATRGSTRTTSGWPPSAACERIGVDRFDLLLLHNPDRIGYSSAAVWEGMRAVREAGLTRMLGVAPGPANGFTLDLIDCIERFGELIDWAMIIFGPLEPWPGEARARRRRGARREPDHPRRGLRGDVPRRCAPRPRLRPYDHRRFRPEGWVRAGREKLERMRPYAAATVSRCSSSPASGRSRSPRALRGADADPPSSDGEEGEGSHSLLARSRTSARSWRLWATCGRCRRRG